MTPDLKPTNRCFHDAIDFLEQKIARNVYLALSDDLILVHGLVLSPPDSPTPNRAYAHAWVEHEGHVWDAGLLDGIRVYYPQLLADFYALRRPQEVTRYSVQETLEQHLASGHVGPWKEEYRTACNPSTEIPQPSVLSSHHQAELINFRAFSGL